MNRLHARSVLFTAGGTLALLLLAWAQVAGHVSSHGQFALLLVGVVLVVVGLGGIGEKDSTQRSQRSEERKVIKIKNFDSVPLLLCLFALSFLAFLLRVWNLETGVRVLVDELAFTQAILRFEGDAFVRLFEPISSIGGFPHVYPYLQTHVVGLLGHNFTGLRAASAVAGALMIPGVYLLGKTLFDRQSGLMAAALLATLPPHLHFSRLALTETAGACCGLWALALLAGGMTANRRLDWALGGALLGMTHYFHESGRLLFTPLVVMWLGGWWLLRRPAERGRDLLVAGLTAALVAMPVYAGIYGAGGGAAIRLADNSTGLGADYWWALLAGGDFSTHLREHILKPLLAYTHARDESLFYMGETALVLPLLVPLFLLGAAYALYHWRRPGSWLLVLWLLAVSAGNSLLIVSVQTPRYAVVFPALALLLALGLRGLAEMGEKISSVLQRSQGGEARAGFKMIGFAISLAALMFLTFYQADYYFNTHLPLYDQQFRAALAYPDGQDAVLRARDFPAGTQLHLISQQPIAPDYVHGLLSFIRPDLALTIMPPEALTEAYLDALPRGVDHAFFLEAYDIASLDRLRARMPLQVAQYSPYDLTLEQQFVLYYVPTTEQPV